MKDKKQHIDKYFGNLLKALQPKADAADWDAVLSKMSSKKVTSFDEHLKDLAPTTSETDWQAIVAKMPKNNQNQKIAWWWLPLLIVLLLVGYPVYKWADKSMHFESVQAHYNKTTIKKENTTSNQTINNGSQLDKSNSSNLTESSKLKDEKTLPIKALKVNNDFNSATNPNQKGELNSLKQKPIEDEISNAIAPPSEPIIRNNLNWEKWLIDSKKLVSLYQISTIDLGSYLSINSNYSEWPKIIAPHKKQSMLLENLSFSPFVSANRYNSNFESNDANWNAKRTNAEKAVILPDVGLKISTSLGKIAISSGLVYSLKGQKIDGNVTYQLYDSFPHLNPQGVIIDYFRLNYRDTTVKVNLTNTYAYLDIPLNLGYPIHLGKKHTLTPTLGTTLSLFTKAKGQSIAPNLGFHNIAKESLYTYRKLMSSWQVQLNYNYLLTNKLQLETGFQIRKNMNSIYTTSYGAKEHFLNLGLTLGLNYKF